MTSAAMGPQPIAKFLDLMREAEAADGGVLYEKHWGLAYKSVAEFYNQPVGLALDFAQGHIAGIPEPADDDQRVRNKWTVSRPSGSEYTAEQTTGPMGTGAQGPGTYADSATVNVETDAQLASQASWRVHVGTVDEDRWPGLGLNFARTPALVDSWADLPYGARVTVAHPVSQMPPGGIDAIVEGYSERWDPYQWVALLNTSPNSPYHIFRLAETTGDLNPFRGYLTPTTCVLAASLDTTSTSVSIDSSTSWSTAADNWAPPPSITVEGEDMTVSAVAQAAQDAFGRTVSNDWGTADGGGAWTIGSGSAIRFAVNGSVGQMIHGGGDTNLIEALLGVVVADFNATVLMSTSNPTQYTERAINVENDDATKIEIGILGTTGGNFAAGIVCRIAGVQLAAVSGVDTSVATTTGMVRVRAQIVGSLARVKVWADALPEPADWTTTLTCPGLPIGGHIALSSFDPSATTTTTFDDLVVSNPQTLTVARSVNTVVKAHPAGAAVAFKSPGVLGL